MKKSRVWQAIVPGTQNKPQDTLQIRKTPWHGVTKQPPAVPLPGPNVTPETNEKIKGLAGNCPRHTKQATRHPSNQENTWHGVTKQPPAVPLPGPNVTPEPNEKIESRVWQAIVPGTQNKPQDTLQIRKTPWRRNSLLLSFCPGQTSLLRRMKKSRIWQAIVPGTQNKPQDTLQIRKTPWHGVTKEPPAVPLPGPNVKLFQAHKTSHKTWHGVTKQPPAVPLPGPNVTPEPNEKVKGLAGNCSRHTK